MHSRDHVNYVCTVGITCKSIKVLYGPLKVTSNQYKLQQILQKVKQKDTDTIYCPEGNKIEGFLKTSF